MLRNNNLVKLFMGDFLKRIFGKQITNVEKEPEAACPYCKKILEQIPQRKKQCPFCKNYIHVRTLPSTLKRILVTEDDARKIDWLKRLDEYGATEQDFEVIKDQLSKKFGQEPSNQDVLWSLFNQLIAKNRDDFQTLKRIYYEMALFLNDLGKDFFSILQLSAKMELMNYKQAGIKNVQILTCGLGSCEQCRQLQDKIFTMEEALASMPIPVETCTKIMANGQRGFCKCCYVAKII